MARLRKLGPALPLLFTTLSFIFILVAITSPSWSIRNYYDESKPNEERVKPIYTERRSPFQYCTGNKTEITNATDSTVTTTWEVVCRKYKAFGRGKTSCELPSALGMAVAQNVGDPRQCQQIHRSGNLVIASTTFISLGLIIMLALSILSLFPFQKSTGTSGTTEESVTHTSEKREKKSTITPLLAFALIASLAIGALTAVLSQFYAILAFTMSAIPNGAFASSGTAAAQDSADPWIEGVALTSYMTVAWVFAGAGAVTAGAVWRMPRWERL